MSAPSSDPDASLRRSDALYRALVRNSAEAIWRVDLDEPIDLTLPVDEQVARAFRHGCLGECNDAMARMYGYTRAEEIVGARLPDLLVESDPANVAYIRAFVEAGYRLDDVESHERDREGRDKYFRNSLVGIIEEGRLIGAWGTQRDVTSQRESTQAQEAEQARMASALDRLNDLQARLTLLATASSELLRSLETGDVSGAIVRVATQLVNADAASVWLLHDDCWSIAAQSGLSAAYASEQVVSGPSAFEEPFQLTDVETAPGLEKRRDSYRREGVKSMLVVPLKIGGSYAGSIVFYQRTPRVFTEVEVRVASALGNVAASALHIAHLYGERATAAQRATFLARAGALLSNTLDVPSTLSQVASLAVPHVADWCAIHLVQPDGLIAPLTVAHVNPEKIEWADRLGKQYPTDQSGRSGVSQVIRTGEPQMFASISDEMLVAGAIDEEHLRVLREMAMLSVLIVPMTARGRNIGAITFISTRESGRHFDDSDMVLAQQLASRAATAVENARLYQEAQEANRLKDEFFATLSHELRTPINAVLGWAQLLRDGVVEGAGQQRAIQAISRNARAQAQLLTDILEMSRIVSGKLELTIEPVDVGALATDLIESLRPTFDARRQTVNHTFEPGIVVQADRARLQQVLFNLLSNAAKFTPEGGRIDLEARTLPGAIEISVRDNGRGISREFMPYVFERFRQADSSSTREHGGLGIGLAVTRHIVDMHGGSIEAESGGAGQGATFTVRLPRHGQPPPAPAAG